MLRTTNLEAQAAAASGIGLALLPRSLGNRHGGLERLPPDGKLPSREVWLVVHAELRRAAPVRAVMAFVADCLR